MAGICFSATPGPHGSPRLGIGARSYDVTLPGAWFGENAPGYSLGYLEFDLLDTGGVQLSTLGADFLENVLRRLEITFVQETRFLRLARIGDADLRRPYEWTPENHAEVAAFAQAVDLTGPGNEMTVFLADFLSDPHTAPMEPEAPATAIEAPTLAAVRLALRIDNDQTHTDSALTRHIEAATARANKQAPTAPEAVAHEAIIRFVAWLYEGPTAPGEISEAGAWRRCGAEGLLSPWTVRRAGAIG